METRSVDLTRALDAATRGDEQAAAALLPLLYEELRRLAHSYMNRQPAGHTLQTTALVHEAYMRLVGNEDPGWNGRGHFFAAAARAMRQILVEQARSKAAIKRGGGARPVSLEANEPEIEPPSDDILAELARVDLVFAQSREQQRPHESPVALRRRQRNAQRRGRLGHGQPGEVVQPFLLISGQR